MKAGENQLSAQLVNATAVSFQTKLPVLLESTSQVYIYLDPAVVMQVEELSPFKGSCPRKITAITNYND